MMNINDEDVRLALGSMRHNIRARLNNYSGAGVNAKSRVDMAFADSDPLSELVWSPRNGLILKCANSRLADKKPILLWNVGPSSLDLSPSQGIKSERREDDNSNALDRGNLTRSQKVPVADDVFGDTAFLVRPSRSFSTPELRLRHGHCNQKSGNLMEDEGGMKDAIQKEKSCTDNREEDLCRPEDVEIADTAEIGKRNAGPSASPHGISDCKVGGVAINELFSSEKSRKPHCDQKGNIEIHSSTGDIMDLDAANPKPLSAKLSEALVSSLPNFRSQKEPDDKLTSAAGEVNKSKSKIRFSIYAPPLRKLESSAENDLCHMTAKEPCSLGEKKLPRENSYSPCVEKFLTISGNFLYQEKGKEKALSDGDIDGVSSNNEDDSHESVESCNSVELFPRGIKRQSYNHGLILGSKRMKKQVNENLGSTSTVRPDSSFKNWILNMVKGLSDSNKMNTCSLALPLACSNEVYGENHQENFLCKKTDDAASPSMGFQTMFQSLYSRNTNVSSDGVQKENDSIEESREIVVVEKASLANPAGSCDRNNDNSYKQIVVADKEVNPVIVGCSPNACGSNLAENKASEILICDRAKDGVSRSDSSGKQMDSSAEKRTYDVPLAMSDVAGKSNPLSSLWITRLSTRIHMVEKCDELAQETTGSSTYSPKVNLDTRVNDVFPIDQKSPEGNGDLADCQMHASFTADTEASIELKLTSKFSPILPSRKFKSSEAMASVFARRLDALRHIIPSKKQNSSTCSLTCFFCGSGHDLRECPNVTETELEDLLIKTSSFEKVKESSCFCIRCFHLDHWAISCPLASSIHFRSGQDISHYASCRLQFYAGSEKCSSYRVGEEACKLIADDPMPCSSRKPCIGSFPSYQTSNVKKPPSKTLFTSNFANDVQKNNKFPLCNIVRAQNTVAPSKEILHAIKNLRLSRADILRCMNSDVSLSHLNGFFLRLRLGKLEAGLGTSSYYVAGITGDAGEQDGCRSNKSILVDVGGIKSSVGSQYISNHDFLEDEIRTWWCTIVKNGCSIPSLDELNSKFHDRKSLGF